MQVACLLLAAGLSRRMEGANKLLLSVGGATVIERTAAEIAKAAFSEVCAVTGNDAVAVSQLLNAKGLRSVLNESYRDGMHSSIRAGLCALHRPYDAVAICLADQPALTKEDYEFLIGLSAPEKILLPLYRGERGNPVVIGREFTDEILREPDRDQGCRYLFERHPKAVIGVEMPRESVVLDVDTPEALRRFEKTFSVMEAT